MHMADVLVTPAVAGTAEPEADGDAYETAAAVYQKFWRSGKHSGPYTCEAGLTGTQCSFSGGMVPSRMPSV